MKKDKEKHYILFKWYNIFLALTVLQEIVKMCLIKHSQISAVLENDLFN